MGWIEVPIVCNTDETSSKIGLGLDVDDSEYDIRTGCVNMDKIIGFYPSENKKATILSYSDTSFEVDIEYNQFKKLLNGEYIKFKI